MPIISTYLIGNNFTVTSSTTTTYSPNVLGWSTGGIQAGNYTWGANATTVTYTVRPENHGQRFLNHVAPSVPTEEETAAQQERRERWRERRRELDRERDAANERARELLFRFLTDEQRESYERDRRFDLVGSLGTPFRIRRDTMANIEVLDLSGEVTGALCAHPAEGEWLPEADKHLGQLLALQTDERRIMRLANCHRGVRPVYDDDRMVV